MAIFKLTLIFFVSLCINAGVYAVYGLLTGGLLSGVMLAVSMSNTGGAWVGRLATLLYLQFYSPARE